MDLLWSSLRLLSRAANLTLEYMGTTAFVVGLGLLVFLLMELYAWRYEGVESMKNRWKGSAGFGALVTIGLWLCLFVFCVVKAVSDDHLSLVNANSQKIEIIKKRDQTIGDQKKVIEELTAKLKEQPKVVYREKKTPVATDASSRHLTKVQTVRLTRMFSELRIDGPAVVVHTIANNQEAQQFAGEINDTLNTGRNTKSSVSRGLSWAKIPEGVLICTNSETDPEVNAAAARIAREMIALGIAVILNPHPSFRKNAVTILVGAKAID